MFDPLWPHGLHLARLPCPSWSPGVCPNSCLWNRWCCLGRLYICKILSIFFLGCPVCWSILFIVIPYDSLSFSGVSCTFFYISDLIFCCLSFSLWPYLKVYQFLFYLFKEPAFSFIDVFCCFIYLFMLWFYFPFSTNFDLIPFSIVPLRVMLDCLCELFLFSWGRPVSLQTFLLELILLYHVDFVIVYFHFHWSQVFFNFFFDFFVNPLV